MKKESTTLSIFLFLLATTVIADTLYKWVDENGVAHFSNTPVESHIQKADVHAKVPNAVVTSEDGSEVGSQYEYQYEPAYNKGFRAVETTPGLNEKLEQEFQYLQRWRAQELEKYKKHAGIRKNVEEKYKEKVRLLYSNPEQYFSIKNAEVDKAGKKNRRTESKEEPLFILLNEVF